jgi:hypothetical protein
MINIDILYDGIKAQEAMNKKVEEEKKAAKAGQIYKSRSDIYVVTFNDGFDICVIYKDGYASDELLEDFNLGDLVAEYPTWEEAVNSKEFKE